MDEEVEGMVVEIEGTVEEVDVELVSAIVGPWDRGCSNTMKRFKPSFTDYNNGVHTVNHLERSYKLREKERKFEKEREEENSRRGDSASLQPKLLHSSHAPAASLPHFSTILANG
nr:hypothetical protein CFP56_54167 [Quercus suber]